MRNKKIRTNSLNFLEALTIALIVLKLCGIIDNSWGWVLSPYIINVCLVLIILTFEKLLNE